MNILLIDNYDSFTYNLFQYITEEGGADVNVTVWRNDQFELDDVEPFDKIILSPGPGVPDEAGLLKAVIRRYAPTKPILGVCLGEQAIGEVFGAEIYNLSAVYTVEHTHCRARLHLQRHIRQHVGGTLPFLGGEAGKLPYRISCNSGE